MTAPDPRWHPRNMTMFDVGRVQQLDHDDIQPKIAHVIGNMLQAIAGGCQSGFCKVRLKSLSEMHLRTDKVLLPCAKGVPSAENLHRGDRS